MQNYISKFLIALSFMVCLGNAQALEIPENKNKFILDQAGVFTPEQEQKLRQQIQSIENKTTVQVAIYTLKKLEGRAISQLAIEVGRKWGVGQKNNNGLLLVIAEQDRKWFFATGYRLEGVLPDILAKRVGEKNFPQNFRKGNYFLGVSRSLQDIKALLEQDPTIRAKYDPQKINKTYLISHIFVGLFIFAFSVHKKKGTTRSVSGSIFLTFHFWLLGGAFLLASGFFVYLVLVLFYGSMASASEFSPNGRTGLGGWDSSGFGGSGGFGGGSSFGGGSFGGGGGGGSW